MGLLKKLLKLLLWLTAGGILLIILTLAGFYLWYAIPMQERFAQLENAPALSCAEGKKWRIPTLLEEYPSPLPAMFGQVEGNVMNIAVARSLNFPYHSTSEWRIKGLIATLESKRRYSKEERLALYMNHAYMGLSADCQIHGIAAAAQFYFGKPQDKLSVAEMALLVGLPRAPSRYNPFDNPEAALERRNTVLKLSYGKGLLTEVEYQAALKEPLPTKPHNP